MIVPTVGRVVLYKQMTAGIFPGSDGVVPAIITKVHSDRCVNLAVFDANGKPTDGRTSMQLVQPEDDCPPTAHCFWMDYQVGQAAKTTEAEKKLAESKR